MANGLTNEELKEYIEVTIPQIEAQLVIEENVHKIKDLYTVYLEVLRLVARDDFGVFNKYLELDDNHSDPNKAFYHHRKKHLKELFESLNDMEIYNKYDILLLSLPPRIGKSQSGIRFLSWIIGRHPEHTQLATSYSDNITSSFYIGVMEIVNMERYKEVFADAQLVNQNAKREEIWLKVMKRYPSITFVPIGGSMTGRSEATDYLYCDDLVSGIEEALSVIRLNSLWQKYTVNARQRKKDGCKEIHIATNWSVHDPMAKLKRIHKDNPRCKILDMSCYDENGESNFDYPGGFSTAYYKDMELSMDKASFSALYKQEPIEREGVLYNEDDLSYYFDLPKGRPDAIVAVCDSKNLGKDYVSSPIAYLYGEFVYIEAVVYNDGLPDVTKQLVANKYIEHNVTRADIEMNNGGNYYAEGVNELVKDGGGNTTFRLFFTGNNKTVKIITYADFVKKKFLFKDKSTYKEHSEYGRFMKDMLSWTQTGNNPHDDGVDSLAMLSQLIQDMTLSSVKVLSRRRLGL